MQDSQLKDRNREDVALVRERLKGRSLASLADELGLTKEGVRLRLQRAFRRFSIAEERRQRAEERCRSLVARIRELELAVARARAGKPPQEVSIAELDLSSGEYLRLTADGIGSLSELGLLSRSQLLGDYQLGERSLQRLEAELARHGLELSTESAANSFRRVAIAEDRTEGAEGRCRPLVARIRELELAIARARAGKPPQEVLIAELDLSSGEYLRLTAGGICSLSELGRLSRSQLLGDYQLSERSLQRLEAELARHGLELSTESPAGHCAG